MRKRIAIIGTAGADFDRLREKLSQPDVEPVAVAPGDDLPTGVFTLLPVACDCDDTIAKTLSLAANHATLLQFVADAVDCREGVAAGSAERMRDHAARFAEALGLSADDRAALELGALLHDIGKLRVPNDVLLKKNVLDYDEWLLLQSHTTLGAKLLEEKRFALAAAPIVRHHHESYDGTGYPDGIEGDEIPYLARIMKIVDVYCAMTSPRHYRSTMASTASAIAYFKDERGKHYDPALVDVFLEAGIPQPLPAEG